MNRQYGAISGVAVALIMLNHAIHFGLQQSPVEGGWLRSLIVLQALGAFAVPAFLFISGAFLAYAGGSWSLRFVRTHLERLLWPYLVWSLAFYVLVFVTTGERQSPVGYVRSLFIGYPYHFVPLLVFWYLAAPAVARLGRRNGALLIGAVGAYQVLLIGLRVPSLLGEGLALPAWLGVLKPPVLFSPMSDWAIYFPLGLVLSMHDASLKPRLKRIVWFTAGTTAVLFLAGILNAFGMLSAPWARFAAPLPLMFLLPAIPRDSIPAWRRLDELGRRSYGIYLVHFAIVTLVAFLAARLRLPLVVLIPVFFVAALGGSLALMDVAARLPALKGVYRLLFGTAPPAQPAHRRVA